MKKNSILGIILLYTSLSYTETIKIDELLHRARTYEREHKYTQALTYYQLAFEQDVAHQVRVIPYRNAAAMIYWKLGDLENALCAFEYYWHAKERQHTVYNRGLSAIDLWNGESLINKTILLYTDTVFGSGLGDTIQMIRYAQCLHKQGATVLCDVQKALEPLLSLCPYIAGFYSDELSNSIDFRSPTMRLPYVFDTTLETIPTNIPYLYPDPDLVAYWHKQLIHDDTIKIGVCWHTNTDTAKNIPLEKLIPLTTIDRTRWFSLQKDVLDIQTPAIKSFDNFDQKNGAFMDTAALIEHLDLVITIDTSVAHLAGAMGKPVWLLLAHNAEFRWQLGRTDSPWYPSMQLFRQPAYGDWNSVIKSIEENLNLLARK